MYLAIPGMKLCHCSKCRR